MIGYLRREKVMTISFILAVISMIFVPPDLPYLNYVDFRVLGLLLSLMLIVKGVQEEGLFEVVIRKTLSGTGTNRRLVMVLILLTFFSSMLITNDVALITFVPFAIAALKAAGEEELFIPAVVLQTLAANLGSMLTPVGNPQNLYLFAFSGMTARTFFRWMLPLSCFSLLVILACLIFIPERKISFSFGGEFDEDGEDKVSSVIWVYFMLFVVSIMTVFRVINWIPALIFISVVIIVIKKGSLFKKVDYALLLTFIGFFIFVGNVGRIPEISQWIYDTLRGHEILTAAALSQVMSNVPAAILLSGFTKNYGELLLGVNIGGLGTLIASMASLISYKLCTAEESVHKKGYLIVFTVLNAAGLLVLLAFTFLVY